MVLVLKHVPAEDAGTILDFLVSKHISHKSVNLYEGQALPGDLKGVSAVVIMGGPMNVYEEDKYGFLKDEDRFIRAVIDAQIPMLGVCLGSQLIAKALGARVMKAPVSEIGWDTLELTEEAAQDALFSIFPDRKLKVLQWHEDTFDMPAGAVRLARSRRVPNQAYRVGERIYGFQFHIEVNRPMLAEWFKKRPDVMDILAEYDAYEKELSALSRRLYERFFAGLSVISQ